MKWLSQLSVGGVALRSVGLVSVAGLFVLSVAASAAPGSLLPGAAGPPSTVSSRYAVVGAGAAVRVGSAVYVAGVTRVAPSTGSAVVVSAANGQAQPIEAPVAGGTVWASIPDGAGGWYIGGSFTSVGGVVRPGLAHLLAGGSLDTAFAPPELGQVRSLALDGGRLYAGGVKPLAAAPWYMPFLSALDPASGAALPVSYPLPPPPGDDESPAVGAIALAAGDGRLFAAFNGQNGIFAYDESSGSVLWSQTGPEAYKKNAGPAALSLAAGRLLVGGQIPISGGTVNLEELDAATGALLAKPAAHGSVSGIATAADAAYFISGEGPTGGVWKLDLSSGTTTRLAAFRFGSAIASDGSTVYVAGSTGTGIGTPSYVAHLRVYALEPGQAKPAPLSQVVAGGSVNALALQGGRLLLGGSFLGMGGVARGGLAAFDARNGVLLPWNPKVEGSHVKALAGSGRTIYLGGAFKRVEGRPRRGLAAVSALGTGKLLPWNPAVSRASIAALAVAGGRVFAGGALTPHGAKASAKFNHLLAFSAATGKQVPFAPKLGHVNLLAVGQGLLLAENSCDHSYTNAYSCVTAFRVSGRGHALWRQSLKGRISALEPDGSTLYLGGAVRKCENCSETALLAAVQLDRSGALLDFHPDVTQPVSALAVTDYGLVVATSGLAGAGPYFVGEPALTAVSPGGQVLPWQIAFPPNDPTISPFDINGIVENYAVTQLVPVPGGLVAGGSFSWIGPPDNPAPGSLVRLQ